MLLKKIIMSIIFSFVLSLAIFPNDNSYSERLYCFKVLSFNKIYEVYCSKKQIGYYKYSEKIASQEVFLTYEGIDFFKKCKFDENIQIYPELLPVNIWTNNRGEQMKFKKKFGPVIEKNKNRSNSNYGFDKN